MTDLGQLALQWSFFAGSTPASMYHDGQVHSRNLSSSITPFPSRIDTIILAIGISQWSTRSGWFYVAFRINNFSVVLDTTSAITRHKIGKGQIVILEGPADCGLGRCIDVCRLKILGESEGWVSSCSKASFESSVFDPNTSLLYFEFFFQNDGQFVRSGLRLHLGDDIWNRKIINWKIPSIKRPVSVTTASI